MDDRAESDTRHPLVEMATSALDRDPGQPIVEFEGRWHTYGDLRRTADAVRALIAESGADSTATIGFVPRNRPAALGALLGLIAEGRTIQMIYAFQSGRGIARDLARLRPAVLIAGPQELSDEVLRAARAEGIAVIVLEAQQVTAAAGLARTTRTGIREPSAPPEIQILTSGTTGAPKQFPVPYSLIAGYITRGTTMYASHGADTANMPPVLLFFPLGNITGIYSTVPTLILGIRIVLLDRFSLDAWLDHIRRFRPAHTGLPPSAVRALLDADIPPDELASIKSLGTGAAPLDPSVQRAFEERYNIPVLLSYGATEFGGRVSAMTAALHARWGKQKLGSVGLPVEGARIRVVDPDTGVTLPAGETGLLEVVSPHVGPDWIRTTDLGLLDRDGFLFLRGRADGAITRGGFKILPETVERALVRHPAVAAASVVGIPDRRLGQAPAAAVQLRHGMRPTVEHLEAHLREHVLATHVPVQWRFVDSLPMNPSMKVDLRGVRALFEA